MMLEQKIILTVLMALLGFMYGLSLDVEFSYRNVGRGILPHFLDYVFGCYGMSALTSGITLIYIW